MKMRLSPVIAAAILVGVAVRVALLFAPPSFLTDVYYYDAEAVSYLAQGIDPYGALYTAPSNLVTAGASAVFAYLPGVFAFLVPAWAAGDARLGLVLCDLVVAAAFLLMRGGRPGLYASVFLLFPLTVVFSNWFLNNSLPAIAFVSVAVLFESRGHPKAASVLWGAAMAASQEAWFIFPLYAYYSLRTGRVAEVLLTIAVALAIVSPFLLWNSQVFVYDTVSFQFTRHAAAFLYSGPFVLNVNPSLEGILSLVGASAPLAVRGGLVLLALAASLMWLRKSLSSLMLASSLFTVLGLFLLAGDFFWSYLELPMVTLLAWSALRGVDSQRAPPESFNA